LASDLAGARRSRQFLLRALRVANELFPTSLTPRRRLGTRGTGTPAAGRRRVRCPLTLRDWEGLWGKAMFHTDLCVCVCV
jgi:hypothetical protein